MKSRLTKKQLVNLALLVFICAAWFAIGWILRGKTWQSNAEITLIEQVRYQLLNEHPGPIPGSRELTYAAIRGMLRQTDDPYAALLEPQIAAHFADDFAGRSGVVGLTFEPRNGQMVISRVNAAGPAEQAGLQAGDVILSVDGYAIDEETTSTEVGLLLRGPAGEVAHFVVQRGEAILDFGPIRQPRTIVSSEMLPGEIAYLAQTAFTVNSVDLMKAALQELLAQNPKGLIWDLRANGGGSMQSTQAILSDFIPEGLLFSAEQKDGQQKRFEAQGNALAPDLPLVVLIDQATYSAGETAAAAIQENQRGILIGAATYGKGVILTTVPLPEGCLLQMTIAKWLSPTGEWYEGRGVSPDIAASDDETTAQDEVLQRAIDYLQQQAAR
ncbi:MAG: S41 family peptidase [Chloroflexota bacterium]